MGDNLNPRSTLAARRFWQQHQLKLSEDRRLDSRPACYCINPSDFTAAWGYLATGGSTDGSMNSCKYTWRMEVIDEPVQFLSMALRWSCDWLVCQPDGCGRTQAGPKIIA